MKKLTIVSAVLAAAMALPMTAASAQPQERVTRTEVHDNGRVVRTTTVRDRHHGVRRVCRTQWRHGHRVRVCRTVRR